MPCYSPVQALYSIRSDGKKSVTFSSVLARKFHEGKKIISKNNLSIPCGNCIGCRLERSRQWGIRIMHEASLYKENAFVTLTFSPEYLDKMCKKCEGGYSLDKKHVQDFVKRLRRRFEDRKIRVFYCGEYGGKHQRPHYHLCLFNCDFKDKYEWTIINGYKYYRSPLLEELWPYGMSMFSDVTFESGAYVARYCTKKINGKMAESHYKGRLPEFCQASLKPGLGADWLNKFGETDVFPHDEVIVRGVKCKPPRFYDKMLEKIDPEQLEFNRQKRLKRAKEHLADSTFERLKDREKCQELRMKLLLRKLENGED